MGAERGFAALCRVVKKFLEEHGYDVHWGAWLDIRKRTPSGPRLIFDLQIGHWLHFRPPRRGVPCAIWVTTEGRIRPEARQWLRGYDYVFAQSRWVKQLLEEIDVEAILMPACIDTQHFRPLFVKKWIDVLSVGIWESSWDNRKFMDRVQQVAFPFTCYVHTRSNLSYEELPLLYNQAKVYVSLTGCEGVNIPVIEANACGLPVVYNDAPATNEFAFGIPVRPRRVYEIEDRGVPFMIHEPDIEKIREEVHRLLRDPKRLEQLGREAREHALRFDYRRCLKPLLEVLPLP